LSFKLHHAIFVRSWTKNGNCLSTMKNNNRQTQRTISTILIAFRELIYRKGYDAITISEITEEANIGRSTFYHHFNNKLDLLATLHQNRFRTLNIVPSTREAWLADFPSQELTQFLIHSQNNMTASFFLYSVQKEHSLIQKRIQNIFIKHIEHQLKSAFSEDAFNIPLSILASAIAGTFTMTLQGWLQNSHDITVEEFALYLHQLMRSQIQCVLK